MSGYLANLDKKRINDAFVKTLERCAVFICFLFSAAFLRFFSLEKESSRAFTVRGTVLFWIVIVYALSVTYSIDSYARDVFFALYLLCESFKTVLHATESYAEFVTD